MEKGLAPKDDDDFGLWQLLPDISHVKLEFATNEMDSLLLTVSGYIPSLVGHEVELDGYSAWE